MNTLLLSLWENLQIPEFSQFLRAPRTAETKIIDPTRLRVSALLDWKEFFSHSDMIIPENRIAKIAEKTDWANNCVLFYNKKWLSYPASVMWFDENHGEIILNQIQWTKDKKVSFRVDSSFDVWKFYLRFLEENFFKNGIPVSLNPDWRKNFMSVRSLENYNSIDQIMQAMKKKYNLE